VSVRSGVVECEACGSVGREIDGILCFSDPQYYWGEISKEAMQESNRLAQEIGWRNAIERTVSDASLREYVADRKRGDFQYIWDLPPESAVLDVGAGWGAIACALGENFRTVVAAEGVFERVRFIQTRAAQLGLSNIHTICADFLHLPLAGEQFDAVVLNGVLEWAAIAAEGQPRQLQVEFLRKIRTLLKPSGFVWLAIENRIGWASIRGSVDHSGFRYTSLMPRRVADAYCRWRKSEYRSSSNTGYRAYTYSLPGYKKLFKDAGFGRARAFQPFPGYNNPVILLPIDASSALQYFADCSHYESSLKGRVKSAGLRAAARTGIWAHLASDYSFLLEKG
jgi:2-polyprenyl-3-methyl-5-hydroxy-6-metoxy-1,4-benzoquinol methylase